MTTRPMLPYAPRCVYIARSLDSGRMMIPDWMRYLPSITRSKLPALTLTVISCPLCVQDTCFLAIVLCSLCLSVLRGYHVPFPSVLTLYTKIHNNVNDTTGIC